MSGRLLLALVLLSLYGLTTASASLLSVDAGTLQVFTRSIDVPPLLEVTVHGTLSTPSDDDARLEIRVELPSDTDSAAIDIGSIQLCGDAGECVDVTAPANIARAQEYTVGVTHLAFDLDATDLARLLADDASSQAITLTIYGRVLGSDRLFSGSATLVIAPAGR